MDLTHADIDWSDHPINNQWVPHAEKWIDQSIYVGSLYWKTQYIRLKNKIT